MQIRKRWSPQQAKLIGKIILSNFLELSLDKFEKYIETTEKLPLFNKLLADGIMTITAVGHFSSNVGKSNDVVAEIFNNKGSFSISYSRIGFNRRYIVDSEKLLALSNNSTDQENYETHLLLCKLRYINTRNEFTHCILDGIIEWQNDYFLAGDELELRPLTLKKLSGQISSFAPLEANPVRPFLRTLSPRDECAVSYGANNFLALTGSHKSRIGEGWISRITKGKSIITPQGKKLPLKFFFHKSKEKKKRLLKQILDEERQDLKSGKIVKSYSDAKLRDKLILRCSPHLNPLPKGDRPIMSLRGAKRRSNPSRRIATLPTVARNDKKGLSNTLKGVRGVSVSKRSISFYRRELGIPSFWKRAHNYTYPPFGENFSCPYPLTFSSIDNNAVESPGVYELSLVNKEIKYTNDKTEVFYIGSAQNLRKRLKEHLGARGKNSSIRKIIKDNKCFFRYVIFHKDWKEEEKRLYKLFVATYGSAPECNKVSP